MTFGGCADRLILWPSTRAMDAGPARQRTVELNGKRIQVWTARSPALGDGNEPQGYVLEFCGNATRAEQIAQFVADRWGFLTLSITAQTIEGTYTVVPRPAESWHHGPSEWADAVQVADSFTIQLP